MTRLNSALTPTRSMAMDWSVWARWARSMGLRPRPRSVPYRKLDVLRIRMHRRRSLMVRIDRLQGHLVRIVLPLLHLIAGTDGFDHLHLIVGYRDLFVGLQKRKKRDKRKSHTISKLVNQATPRSGDRTDGREKVKLCHFRSDSIDEMRG